MRCIVLFLLLALSLTVRSYDLNWWGPYLCESAPGSVDAVRALDLTVLDWSDPVTLVIVGNTLTEVDDTLEIEFMASEIELDDESRDIDEIWFLEYDNSGADDDGYGVFKYEDSSSNERYLGVGFHNVAWPPDGSTGTPSGMGILSLDIADETSYSVAIQQDEDWIQEANLWDAVHVPDLSDFASGNLADGFAACGWCFECDPDTVSSGDSLFIHGLVWLKSLYSYPSCDEVVEDAADEFDIGTWGYIIYDDNSSDPLIILGGMHGDGDELSHRLGVIDNEDDGTIYVGYMGSESDVEALEGPVAKVETCGYVMVDNYDDDGDEAVCASYWSYRPGNNLVTCEDSVVFDNEISEILYGYDTFNVFATAVSPTTPPTKLIVLMSAKESVTGDWGVLLTTITLDTENDEVGAMATPTFLELDDFPEGESEFKAHSFIWDTMAPIHGLGVGSFLDLGRICVFELE
jgi:hypothetical protein